MRDNKILPLPSISTINEYLKNVRVDVGFDKGFFKDFKKKLSSMKERYRHGVLLFDEMKIKKHVAVNARTLTFDGLSDTITAEGTKEGTNEKADYALVFMFSTIHGNIHQPIATFLSKNATKGEVLAKLILQAITEVENAGGKVFGLTCDGASPNRKMWSSFKISGKIENLNVSMCNPVNEFRSVYFFSDVPHLLKCVRNRLKENDLKVSLVVNNEVYKILHLNG